jgi:hypothetical protein
MLLRGSRGVHPESHSAKGLETLDNPKVIGMVLNDAREVANAYYSHYYYHRMGKTHSGKNG